MTQKKRPRDVNSMAKSIVDEATGDAERTQAPEKDPKVVVAAGLIYLAVRCFGSKPLTRGPAELVSN